MPTQLTTVLLADGFDGSPASETVVFSLDGVEYAIDLNNAHAQQLREELRPFIAAARKIRTPRQT